MLTGPYFKSFVGILRLAKYSFALPYRWNPIKRELYGVQSKIFNAFFILGFLIGIVYVGVLGNQLLTKFSSLKPGTSMLIGLWLLLSVGIILTKLVVIKWNYELKEFFNLVIRFEDDYFLKQDGMRCLNLLSQKVFMPLCMKI